MAFSLFQKKKSSGVVWFHGGGYIDNLKKVGIHAHVDVYEGMYHAFDLMEPDHPTSRIAIERFNECFSYAQGMFYAEQVLDKTVVESSHK